VPKIYPFHSAREPVYHDNDQCEAAKQVPEERRLKGNEGKPLCKECEKLDAEGK
jgi:hypothetical protein